MRPVFIGRDTSFAPSLSVAGVTYAVVDMSRHIQRNARWMLAPVERAGVQAWSCACRGFVAGVGNIGGFRPPSVRGYVTTCLAELDSVWSDDVMRSVLDEMDRQWHGS
jgi:hypothetical protein